MNIECPKCDFDHEDVSDSLPTHACDSVDFECGDCEHIFTIGWSAEVDIRDDKLDKESIKERT